MRYGPPTVLQLHESPSWQALIDGQLAGPKIRPFDQRAHIRRVNPAQLIEKDRSARAGLIETQRLAQIDNGRRK